MFFPETIYFGSAQPWPMSTYWLQSTTGWSWHVPWEREPQLLESIHTSLPESGHREFMHISWNLLVPCPIGFGNPLFSVGNSKACIAKPEPVPGISLCDSWCLSTRVRWPSMACLPVCLLGCLPVWMRRASAFLEFNNRFQQCAGSMEVQCTIWLSCHMGTLSWMYCKIWNTEGPGRSSKVLALTRSSLRTFQCHCVAPFSCEQSRYLQPPAADAADFSHGCQREVPLRCGEGLTTSRFKRFNSAQGYAPRIWCWIYH